MNQFLHRRADIDGHPNGVCFFRTLPSLLLMLVLLPLHGQTSLHLEFPVSQYPTEIRSTLCDTNGLCILYPSSEASTTSFHLDHYKTNLLPANKLTFGIAPSLTYITATYDADKIFLIFQHKTKKKLESTGMLYRYDCRSMQLDSIEIANLPTEGLSQLKSYKGLLFFVGKTGKDYENLYFLNASRKFASTMYIPNAPQFTIEDYLIDTLNHRVVSCINTSSNTHNNVLWICETSLDGNVQFTQEFPDTLDKRYLTARIVQTGTDHFFVAGTWQDRKFTMSYAADGSYTTLYDGGHFTESNHYPFDRNYYTRNDNGNSELLHLPGRLFTDSTRYVFVTEAYYPEYRYSTTYSYGMPTTEAIFMGYHFINADVRMFDTTGHMTWEYRFPFENTLVTNITPHLRLSFLQNGVLFYYQIGQNLFTMLTDNDMEIVAPIRQSSVFPANNQTNQTRYTTGLFPWYNDYYILSGYRFATRGSSKDRAKTFFLYKLKYK